MSQNQFWNLLAKKLSGEASAEEKTELEFLIKTHPELSYTAQHLSDLWELNKPSEATASEEAFQKHLHSLSETDFQIAPPNQPVKSSEIKWYLIAGLALLIVSFWGATKFLAAKPIEKLSPLMARQAEVSTRPGSRTKLVLPDSSVVWLNAGSKLTYDRDFGNSNRNTTLTGEAFFDVKKSTVPFIIQTSAIKIKVLGTAFNVKSYPNEETTETSLIRGRVEVSVDKRPGEIFILKPNEKLVVANSPEKAKSTAAKKHPLVVLKELTRVNDNLVYETSWVENKLVFHDESLEDMARKMERWYNVTIDIQDKKLAQMEVGGGPFENESIQEALTALQIAFNFKFKITENHIIITN